MLETWGGINHPKLRWYISKYDTVLGYLKLTWKFGTDDKVVDVKRWLVFHDGDSLFWDYLDATHEPAKKELEKQWLNCIKLVLNNWKEFVFAEINSLSQKLPNWVHSIEEYTRELDEFGNPYDPNSYSNRLYDVMAEIRVAEHEYFASLDSQEKQRKMDLLKTLDEKN